MPFLFIRKQDSCKASYSQITLKLLTKANFLFIIFNSFLKFKFVSSLNQKI
jgi:hypothetical protein